MTNTSAIPYGILSLSYPIYVEVAMNIIVNMNIMNRLFLIMITTSFHLYLITKCLIDISTACTPAYTLMPYFLQIRRSLITYYYLLDLY